MHVEDGWEPLCDTLGKEVSSAPFPHVNDTETSEEIEQMCVKRLESSAFVSIVEVFAVWYRF